MDASLDYCNGDNPEINWNYILGCYSGSVSNTKVESSTSYQIPGDCVEEDTGTTPSPTPAPAPTGCSDETAPFLATKPGDKGWTKYKTCDGWVNNKSTAWRCLNVAGVKENCQATCTNCCVENTGTFNLLFNNKTKTCAWVGLNKEVRCRKAPSRQNCPITCELAANVISVLGTGIKSGIYRGDK